MAVRFTCRTLFTVPPAVVFAAALSIDAHVASMSHSGERAVAGVTGGRIGLGESVTWRARHFGIWWTMTSRVTELDEPSRFVDEQVSGPFRRFRHEHVFNATDGGTEMIDVITFAAPGGPLGLVAERALLARYLNRLISDRNAHLMSLTQPD